MTFSEILRYTANAGAVIFFVCAVMGFWNMRLDYIRSDKKVKPWLTDVAVLKGRGVTPSWFTKWSTEAMMCFTWMLFGFIRLPDIIELLTK